MEKFPRGSGCVQIAYAHVALGYHFACRALLRHSITFWIYLPLQMIAEEFAVDRSQLPVFDVSNSGSYGEVINGLVELECGFQHSFCKS